MAARKRLARLAIGAHPPGWRRRYAEEVLALVAAAGVTWRHAFDLLRSAAGEWFSPSQRWDGPALERWLTAAIRILLVSTVAGAAGATVAFAVNMTEALVWDGLRYFVYGLPPKVVGNWFPNWDGLVPPTWTTIPVIYGWVLLCSTTGLPVLLVCALTGFARRYPRSAQWLSAVAFALLPMAMWLYAGPGFPNYVAGTLVLGWVIARSFLAQPYPAAGSALPAAQMPQ